MRENVFLKSAAAERLYASVKDLPIIDYHCHLSPEELYLDKPFNNIGEMWLGGDHYKWRLMREAGIDERLITGDASWEEKFVAYAECVELAVGNPLYHWSALELERYFGITEPLTAENAHDIYRRASERIAEMRLSPRKCVEMMKVEYVCTTDDPADDLNWHRKFEEDQASGNDPLSAKIAPAFRADNVVNIRKNDYRDYIARLEKAAGIEIKTLAGLEQALSARLDVFCELNCRFADVGVEGFPSAECSREKAERIFASALKGESISDSDYSDFLGHIYRFLAGEYAKRGMISQLHLAVKRNPRTALFERLGPDCGIDCAADAVSPSALAEFLNSCEQGSGLPETIVYTLEPSNAFALATAAFSFPRVKVGAAWWFADTLGGIAKQLEVVAEAGYLAAFPGMLTDSRSFLSYPRHDFYRRIAASVLGEWVERGEAEETACIKVMQRICYENAKKMANI